MVWHGEKKEDVAKELQSQPKLGLTNMIVGGRLAEYGENIRTGVRKRSRAGAFFAKLLAPLSLMLCGISVLWIVLNVLDSLNAGTDPLRNRALIYPAAVLLSLVLLAAVRTSREIAAAGTVIDMIHNSSAYAKVRRGSVLKEVHVEELVPGDIVQLEAGDVVPADGRLLITSSFTCDESALTGSDRPVAKDSDAVLDWDIPLEERVNMVYAGTSAVSGRALMVVTETGMNTEIARRGGKKPRKLSFRTPMVGDAYRTRAFTVWAALCISLSAATLFALRLDLTALPGSWDEVLTFLKATATGSSRAALYSLYRNQEYPYNPTVLSDAYDLLVFLLLLAVCAVPLGLPQNVMHALAAGLRTLRRGGNELHDYRKAERIGRTTLICTDKTGTLTRSEMTVAQAWPLGDVPAAVDEGFWSEEMKYLMKCAALCCDSKLLLDYEGRPISSGDRTETAIISAYVADGNDMEALQSEYPRVAGIPFDSARKLMSVIFEIDGLYMVVTKGAPEVLAPRCINADMDEIQTRSGEMCDRGLRVIAVAVQALNKLPEEITPETVEKDLIFIGLLGLDDPCRDDVAKAVRECADAGIRTVMLTGDHPGTAVSVARQLGMLDGGQAVLTGEELAEMSDRTLRRVISDYAVFARISPEDKTRLIRIWQEKGECVMMASGGVGDAPALHTADISCAMAETAADVAIHAADITISGNQYLDIRRLVKAGRAIRRNLAKLSEFSLTCCIAQTATLLGGRLLFHQTVLKILPMILLNLLLFVFLQPFFADEPAEKDAMRAMPDTGERIIDWFGRTRAALSGGLIAFNALALYRFIVGKEASSTALQGAGLSSVFVLLSMSLVLYALCVRSDRPFIVTAAVRNRGLLLGALAVVSTLLFMTVYVDVAYAVGLGVGFLSHIREIGALLLLELFAWQYPRFYSYVKKY